MNGVPTLMKINLADKDSGFSFLGFQARSDHEIDPTIPYVAAVNDFMAQEDVSHDHVILFSDEPKIARKAAALLARKEFDSDQARQTYEDPFDEFEDEFEDDDEEYFDVEELMDMGLDDSEEYEPRNVVRELDIGKKFDPVQIPGNPYHTLLQTMLYPAPSLLITKLEIPDKRDEKLEAIEAVMDTMVRRTMLLLPTSEKDSAWVKDIIREYDFSPLELPSCTGYLKSLVSKEGVELESGFADRCYLQAKIDYGMFLDEDTVARYATDPIFQFKDQKPAFEELNSMIGLEDPKNAALELAAMLYEMDLNPELGVIRKSMIFEGNPGSGKTTVAELITRVLAETGNARNAFVTVSRSDLIGKYVGHTAPKVEKKFDEARGGVLFVDEAGFFLGGDHTDQFASEAIKEFVRYMELYADVTVIFAMYKNEVEDFLNLDEGLSSRICRRVVFEDYTNEELVKIAHYMAEKQGYKLSPKSNSSITAYIDRLRKRLKNNYGNAREIRKLIETAIKKHAVKDYLTKAAKKANPTLSTNDVNEAIASLEKNVEAPKQTLGFAAPNHSVQTVD